MTRKISIFAFCSAVLALLLWVFCGPDVAAEAVYPVENGANWFSRKVVRRFKAAFAAGSALVENDRLRAEVTDLKMACADADRIAAENVRLRRMLGLDESGAATQFGTNAWLCAPIVSRGAAAGNPCLLRLGRGFLSGVKPGAVVAVPEGLVGRIGLSGRGLNPVATTETSLLYIVPPLRIQNVAQQPTLPPRARIITSGLGGVFPRGLLVGFLIDGAHGDEANLEQEGDVEPAVDFLSLENVFIRRAD